MVQISDHPNQAEVLVNYHTKSFTAFSDCYLLPSPLSPKSSNPNLTLGCWSCSLVDFFFSGISLHVAAPPVPLFFTSFVQNFSRSCFLENRFHSVFSFYSSIIKPVKEALLKLFFIVYSFFWVSWHRTNFKMVGCLDGKGQELNSGPLNLEQTTVTTWPPHLPISVVCSGLTF